MVKQLIVPLDGSESAWRAFDVALALGERTRCDVRVVQIETDPADGRRAESRLQAELGDRGPFDIDINVDVRLTVGFVADELATLVSLHPGAVVVMSSHGRGRSAAVVGSVAEDLIRKTFGPIMLVGPHVEPVDFAGPIVVGVDGSQESEAALPLAAGWAIELCTTPWVVHVSPPDADTRIDADVIDTGYPARLASELRAISGHVAEFDELHDRHPARAIADFAARHHASMIIASSHGRSGLSRLLVGSVTADLVRHATCPVTVVRLPHPTHAEQRDRMWAY